MVENFMKIKFLVFFTIFFYYFFAFCTLSFPDSKISLSFSMHVYCLCVLMQAIAVVMLPAQESRTISFSFEYVFIIFSIKATGFYVGCIADFCMSFEKVHTEVGYLSVLSYDVRLYSP